MESVKNEKPPKNLPNTSIEIIGSHLQRGAIRSALFDFDGTLSLIREGWQDVMIPMMVDILSQYAEEQETEDDLYALVTDFVTQLTGKQTIYQMIRLCEEIEKRGSNPKEPLDYKYQYLDLLWQRIKDRVAGLKSGRLTPEEMLVPGSLEILENFYQRRVVMYLASGTDRPYVLDEASALGLGKYFGERIFGAIDDYENYSKAMVIQDIITTHNLHGKEFVVFGDGYVEIENTKEIGGIAIGVATNEKERKGIDQWKRQRLIAAGADLIIPDFREQQVLIAYLFGEI